MRGWIEAICHIIRRKRTKKRIWRLICFVFVTGYFLIMGHMVSLQLMMPSLLTNPPLSKHISPEMPLPAPKTPSSTQTLQRSSCGHFCTCNSICGLHLINLIIYGEIKFSSFPAAKRKTAEISPLSTIHLTSPRTSWRRIRAEGTSKYANICSYIEQRRQSAQQMALAEVRRDGATNGIHMKGKALLWVDAKKYHLFI